MLAAAVAFSVLLNTAMAWVTCQYSYACVDGEYMCDNCYLLV